MEKKNAIIFTALFAALFLLLPFGETGASGMYSLSSKKIIGRYTLSEQNLGKFGDKCNIDRDCMNDQWVGNFYCKNEDIYRDNIDFYCDGVSKTCKSAINSRLVNVCGVLQKCDAATASCVFK